MITCFFFNTTNCLKIFSSQFNWFLYLYSTFQFLSYLFYLYTMLFSLSVCLFASNKRQKSWTNRVQILLGTSLGPKELFMNDQIFKNLHPTKLDFHKILTNFENKPNVFLWNLRNFILYFFTMNKKAYFIINHFSESNISFLNTI